MIKKHILNSVVIFFGLFLTCFRIYSISNGTGFSNIAIITIPLLFLIILVITIIQKMVKAFVILLILSAIAVLFPFEYLYGLASFKLANGGKELFLKNINNHYYDSLLNKNKYEGEATRTQYNGKNAFIYKDSTLLAVYFWQSFWLSKELYCGTLYISDDTKITDPRVYNFLHRELEYKKLSSNWYWVKCYIDLEPGP